MLEMDLFSCNQILNKRVLSKDLQLTYRIMKILILSFLSIFFIKMGCAQRPSINRPHCENEKFDKKVSQLIDFTVPVISPEQLKDMQDEAVVFDTREQEEYDVSHIAGAKLLGFDKMDKSQLENLDKDAPIVVYCSVGYRSEKIGEKLQKLGFTNVYNLYGSLFEWVNTGNPVVDKDGEETKKVHTYNKKWSQWLEEGKGEKVW